MTSYRRLNNLTGWIIFLIASVVYILTAEPTTSFWDCGEYISTAFKLQVGHPPGAPFFQLLGRFFSLFAFGDNSQVAFMINTMSALSSSFTILFLFWTITMLAKRLVIRGGEEMTKAGMWTILSAGIVGSLAYAFSDSFWFSAVEGEVYAMSSLFTAMVFWAVLRWEQVADEKHADRWLILIAYLMGLSIGVHLLNLLAIPAIGLIIYFRKYRNYKFWRVIFVILVSFLVLAAIMYGIIPETLTLFANTELLFVNGMGLPFHTGTIVLAVVLISLLVIALIYTQRPTRRFKMWVYILGGIMALFFLLESDSAGSFFLRIVILAIVAGFFFLTRKLAALQNTVILSLVFILIGYSSFIMLVIRSNAETPINENSPKDAISLLSYLNREQYGDWPLLKGPYYNAPVIGQEDGKPVYMRDSSKGKYVIKDDRKGTKLVYDPEYITIFPRMWNNTESRYIEDYKRWAGIKGDPDGKRKPTFGENLRYFFDYQLGHMYFRYFMWNFAGRQNEIQGHGDLLHGNWLSGITFLDEMRLGPQKNLPDNMKSKARNTYYFLPLILGLFGLFYQFRKKYHDGLVVTLLFVMTGLAIVVYLNQHAPQPRERDYAYAASFYAFSIWIGLGVIYLVEKLSRYLKPVTSVLIVGIATVLLVPANMGYEGWDDHSRSGRYTALEVAKCYLNSCEPNAILFTNGDNDTFPLWYAQEVEGIRTDVRVCNLSLLSGDWYISQMQRKVYDADPVPFTLNYDQYKQGTRDVVYLIENENIKGYVELKELFNIMKRDEDKLKIRSGGQTFDYFPAKKFRVSVDSAEVIANNAIPAEFADRIEDIEWTVNTQGVGKNHLMVLDLIAHIDWTRPVYFSTTTGDDAYLGIQKYFVQEGMAYRLIPARIKSPDHQVGGVSTEAMYNNLMNRYSISMADSTLFWSEENIRAAMNLRNIYGRLAQELIRQGKKDSAALVADRITEIIPDASIPYDYFVVPVADAYYKSGRTDKGDAILVKLYDHTLDNLYYFFSFTGDKAEKVDFQRQQNLAMMQEIYRLALENQREDIAGESKKIFDQYYQRYVGQPFNR
ncbi:MAG: DUF2723 domain-containing protein [Bacteroidetes bacterium]|nr:DUF2723 domain-containing protein [Bacteroidota bacterium]